MLVLILRPLPGDFGAFFVLEPFDPEPFIGDFIGDPELSVIDNPQYAVY